MPKKATRVLIIHLCGEKYCDCNCEKMQQEVNNAIIGLEDQGKEIVSVSFLATEAISAKSETSFFHEAAITYRTDV